MMILAVSSTKHFTNKDPIQLQQPNTVQNTVFLMIQMKLKKRQKYLKKEKKKQCVNDLYIHNYIISNTHS